MLISDLPICTFTGASMKAPRSGIYIYMGSSAATVTLSVGYGGLGLGEDDARYWTIKNSATAAVTLTVALVAGTFWDTSSSVSTLSLTQGQAVTVAYDGTYYHVTSKAN